MTPWNFSGTEKRIYGSRGLCEIKHKIGRSSEIVKSGSKAFRLFKLDVTNGTGVCGSGTNVRSLTGIYGDTGILTDE